MRHAPLVVVFLVVVVAMVVVRADIDDSKRVVSGAVEMAEKKMPVYAEWVVGTQSGRKTYVAVFKGETTSEDLLWELFLERVARAEAR